MRRTPRPFGTSIRPTRVVSLLLGLAVLAMLYDRFKDPATWRFLATEEKPTVVAQLPGEPAAPPGAPAEEKVIPGPNDTDHDEVLDNADMFDAVRDRQYLTFREMPAYWKLLEWSRTQPLADLEKRARRDVLMAHLWNEPQKHKAQHPIRLRIDVVRCLPWDGESNPLGVNRVFEAWGATQDSRGNPYCVVLVDPPPDLPIGANVSARIEFTGYFLKNFVHDTFDGRRRATPLLLGRARTVAVPKIERASEKSNGFVTMFLIAAGLGCAAVVGALFFFRGGGSPRVAGDPEKSLPASSTINTSDDTPFSGGAPPESGGPPGGIDFDGIMLGEFQSVATVASPLASTSPIAESAGSPPTSPTA